MIDIRRVCQRHFYAPKLIRKWVWVFTLSPFHTKIKRKENPLGFACQAFWYKFTQQWLLVRSSHKTTAECCPLTHVSKYSLIIFFFPSISVTNSQKNSKQLTDLFFTMKSTTFFSWGLQRNLNLTNKVSQSSFEISIQCNHCMSSLKLVSVFCVSFQTIQRLHWILFSLSWYLKCTMVRKRQERVMQAPEVKLGHLCEAPRLAVRKTKKQSKRIDQVLASQKNKFDIGS